MLLSFFRPASALRTSMAACLVAGTLAFASPAAAAQQTAFRQAVAASVAGQADVAEFYRARDYAPLWTGPEDTARLNALLVALDQADQHGLPAPRYGMVPLMQRLQSATTPKDQGFVEAALTRAFLLYARDMKGGALVPSSVDDDIKRRPQAPSPAELLQGLAEANPAAYFRALAPQSNEYTRLLKAKLQLENVVAEGGWGETVAGQTLKPGQSGAAVVTLRNRLMRMGYLHRSFSKTYDADMQGAVQQFQLGHGLEADGVAGQTTMAELNVSAETRLKSVIVALERERWVNIDKSGRHILVNLVDYTAKIMDQGEITFETRSVVGANSNDRRSPEFSDVMEFMVINPTWHVPRSIAVNEYLPQLKQNPNAVSHLVLFDGRGQRVSRQNVDFSAFTANTFPFDIKQPPSNSNALGLVKFMFPNPYNIYLHDTPAKNLFARETRAYSHGCIRLAQPFDFAYALLARQSSDPVGEFKRILATGVETTVPLRQPVPVHLIYRTAFTTAKGGVQFRRDVYGRDAKIWQALEREGVALRAYRG
jgi:murein L,D-transpeptidase YcbB/YkuD